MKKIVDPSVTTFLQEFKKPGYNLPAIFEAVGRLMEIYGYTPTHSFCIAGSDSCDVKELGFVGAGHAITVKIEKLRSGVKVTRRTVKPVAGAAVDPKDLPF